MLYIKSMRSVVCTSESSSATVTEKISLFDANAAQPRLWRYLARFGCGLGSGLGLGFPDCERSSWMLCLEGLYQYYSRLSRPAVEVGNSELR